MFAVAARRATAAKEMAMRDVMPSLGSAAASVRNCAETGRKAERKARKPMIYKGVLALRHLAIPRTQERFN